MIGTYDYESIAGMIDHSMLSPALTERELAEGCELAIRYRVAGVVVPPYFAPQAAKILEGTMTRPSTTVGFPHGSHTTAAKLAELGQALLEGIGDIETVINIGKARSRDWFYIEDELRKLTDAAHAGGAKIVATFENAYLDIDAKVRLCEICTELSVDCAKTATGFAFSRASIADLRLMREHLPGHIQVKAAGGIREFELVVAIREMGVNRIGTPHTGDLLDECQRQLALDPVAARSSILVESAY